MTSRCFNYFCLSLGLFFLTGTSLWGQKIGLQLYSLREQFKKDVPGTLAKIASWDIKYIEGGGTYGMDRAAFIKLLDQHDLKVVSVGADFNQLANEPEKVVENAKAFGAKYVMCAWIPHNGDDFTLEDTKKAVDVFNRAGKLLRENGLRFTYHIHGYEFRPHEGGTFFDYMVANTDPKHVNFELDVFWAKQPGQDPAALLMKYPKRFPLLHLKDRRPGTKGDHTGHADVETNVVLGQGDVGIAEVMKAAKKAKVKYAFIEDESSRVEEQVPKSLTYLDQLD